MDKATRLLLKAMMTPGVARRVKTKSNKQVCVRAGCSERAAPKCRGNCEGHYNAFKNQKQGMTDDEKDAFDKSEVAKGNILPPNRGRKRSKKNPYPKKVVA